GIKMREIIARIVSALTVVVVLALSLLFASAHNQRDATELETPAPAPAGVQGGSEPAAAVTPMAPAPTAPVAAAAADDIARGRAVYEKQNCATCHSIAGEGNPRYPLDGVGASWDAG